MTPQMAQGYGAVVLAIGVALHLFMLQYTAPLLTSFLYWSIDHDLTWIVIILDSIGYLPFYLGHLVLFIIQMSVVFAAVWVTYKFCRLLTAPFRKSKPKPAKVPLKT